MSLENPNKKRGRKAMNILKAAYITFSAAMVAVATWAIASYIDAICGALLQPWNMWALMLGL